MSGKKNELLARLALWYGLRIFDGPRSRRHRDRVADLANNLDRFVAAHSVPPGATPLLHDPFSNGLADY